MRDRIVVSEHERQERQAWLEQREAEILARRPALEALIRDEEHRRASRRREADRRDRKERRRLTWQAIKRRLFP